MRFAADRHLLEEQQVIKRILSWLNAMALGVTLLLPLVSAAQSADKPFGNEQLDQERSALAAVAGGGGVEC